MSILGFRRFRQEVKTEDEKKLNEQEVKTEGEKKPAEKPKKDK